MKSLTGRLRSFAWVPALVLLLGCGARVLPPETTAPGTALPETTVPGTTATEALVLEELYYEGMAVLEQMGDSAPILFPETDVRYLDNFYPGLAQVPLKQLYAGVAPVTGAPFEVILLEVERPQDVETVLELFRERVRLETRDTAQADYLQAWQTNCVISARGPYVFLAVLMPPCQIPESFILR